MQASNHNSIAKKTTVIKMITDRRVHDGSIYRNLRCSDGNQLQW